jgi:hypothetical protein
MPHVFILSSPRSGSTLTRLTLDKISGLVTLPETHFWVFKNFYNTYSLTKDIEFLADKWVNFYSIKKYPVNHNNLKNDIINNAKSWKDILNITSQHYLLTKFHNNIPENIIVCEKSPPHIFYKAQIQYDYPDAKFIFLIRDPRDVVASLKTCSWSTSNPLINALVWRNGVRNMHTTHNAMIVKYENLVNNPDTTLADICSFIGITYTGEINYAVTEDVVEANNPTSKNALKPISNKFISTYKTKLSSPDREQEIIEKICSKEMIQLGYTIEKYKRNDLHLWLRIFYYRIGWLIAKFTKKK